MARGSDHLERLTLRDSSTGGTETVEAQVFVAGDARAESAKRVASAVGEGAIAVMLVHRYVERL